MKNKEIFKILLIDKIKRDVREYSFKTKAYWNEFKDITVYFNDSPRKTYYSLLEKDSLNILSIKQLKSMYEDFLFKKSLDIKYSD